MAQIKINKNFINNVVKLALNEDLYPSGDITSSLIKNNKVIKLKLISNQKAIIGGLKFAEQTFRLIDKKIKFIIRKKEGSPVKKNDLIAIIEGKVQNILVGERVALNFISHISGVATKTNQFVKLVKEKKCKICCTRKTIPNMRVIQKYAVKLGGGINHRFNLSDEYLIKDNHISSSDIKTLVHSAIKKQKGKKITVEIDNLNLLKKSNSDIAILPHKYGIPMDLSNFKNEIIIEDCCQALGAKVNNKHVGLHGTVGIYSFYVT